MAVLTTLPGWMLPATLLSLAVIAGFFVVARGMAPAPGTGPVVTGAVKNTLADLQPGARPPDFSATALDGGTIHLGGLRGKVVLVNFFASWCGECRVEFPDLQAAWTAHRDAGFVVVAVDAIDTGDGPGFYRQMGATFPAVRDPGRGAAPGPIAHAYGITTGLPVSVFIDRAGRVHQVYPGRIDATIIRTELAAMGLR